MTDSEILTRLAALESRVAALEQLRKLQSEEDRRAYNREAQQRYRKSKRVLTVTPEIQKYYEDLDKTQALQLEPICQPGFPQPEGDTGDWVHANVVRAKVTPEMDRVTCKVCLRSWDIPVTPETK